MEIQLDGHEKADDRGIELDRRLDKFKDRKRQDHRLGDDQFDYLIGIIELPALLGSKAQFRAELDHKSTMPEASLSVSSVSRPPLVSSYTCVRLRDWVFKLTCGSQGNRVRVGAHGASATP